MTVARKQITKRQAIYRRAEHLARSCGTCSMFRPNRRADLPGTCTLVFGKIRAAYTCRYWEQRALKVDMTRPPSRAPHPHVRVYVYNADGQMLVLRRREGHPEAGNTPGTFESVQGGIVNGEDPFDAAKRELREETRYYADDIDHWRRVSVYTFEAYLKEGVRQPNIADNPDKEHDWWGWRAPNIALQMMGRTTAKADVPDLPDDLAELLGPLLGEAASEGVLDGFAELDLDDERAFDLANEDAVDYATSRAAELLQDLTETTRAGVRGVIAQATNEGWSAARTAAAIEESYAFSADRAAVVARTELAQAHTQGNLAAWRRAGADVVMGKRWVLADDHDQDDDCDENADVGVIPLEASFPSGDDGPPAHPNCKCVVVAVVQTSAEEDA